MTEPTYPPALLLPSQRKERKREREREYHQEEEAKKSGLRQVSLSGGRHGIGLRPSLKELKKKKVAIETRERKRKEQEPPSVVKHRTEAAM